MAGNKYLINDATTGQLKQVAANDTTAGAADAGKLVALDGSGRIAAGMMPVGVGADTKSLTASENLSAGNLINVWNDAGTTKVRKADVTTSGKEADGFVLAAATSGNPAEVYFEGTITGLSSLTPGTRMFASTTPGTLTATPPSGSGNVVQYVGRAVSATEVSFEPTDGVILA